MQYRELGRTGWKVSAISFGAWAMGGDAWGPADDRESLAALNRALDEGVNLFDTADIYGGGRSEQLLGRLRRERSEPFFIATKAGRKLQPHTVASYSRENLAAFIEQSLRNLGAEALDLLQLHCPPIEAYYRPEVFDALDDLQRAGKIRHYGVSVERVEEALKALEYPGVQSIQIIFNVFRQRPRELLFREAARRGVGILARLPLSSGMLSGRYTRDTRFDAQDHRTFNRHGEAFDRGETFSGVDYETGLGAVEELRSLLPGGMTLTQLALRWILMFPEVTCAIPGARRVEQIRENAGAADQPALPQTVMSGIESVYERSIRKLVHQYW